MKLDRMPLLAPASSVSHANLARGRSISDVKVHNARAVLLALLRCGAASRVDLARMTGLSSTTITNLITELIDHGLVLEAGKEHATGARGGLERAGAGRPATMLRIVPDARCAAGLHIGVDTLHAGVTDLFGQLLAHRVVPHQGEVTPQATLDLGAALIRETIAEAEVQTSDVIGIGVGASGLTDPTTGINTLSPNLGWRNVPVRDIMAGLLNKPVLVDNNVRAMALAESMFGAGRGVNTLAFVYSRVGVGAGFVLGGQLYRGATAGGGEIGHTTVIPAGGAACRCGNSGCLETLVSEVEIVRQALAVVTRDPDSILAEQLAAGETIDAVFEAARAGDRHAAGLLEDRAFYLGTALANLVNTLNPDMIILGGLFAAGADLMLPRIEETMRRRAFAGLGDQVQVRVTEFGRRVGVVGAAALALDAFFYRQSVTPEGVR
jgi:glucokinase-like ROK family protein